MLDRRRRPHRLPGVVAWIGSLALATALANQAAAEGTFRVSVKGAFDLTLKSPSERASFRYEPAPEGLEGFPPTHTLTFVRFDQSKGYAVTIVFYGANTPEAGTHTIEWSDDLEGSVIAHFSDRASLSTFGADAKGTIQLTRNGDAYSGSFAFEAKESGKVPPEKSVTVEGEFADIRLSGAHP